MTNEEAIRYFKRHIDLYCVDGISREAEEMAIKALEQQPCDNAISHEAVCEIISDIRDCISVEGYCAILERLKKLSSVTLQQKSGKWIEHPEIETSAPEYLMFYECSECGDKPCFCKSDIHKKKFCSNCGTRMVEPQERSDKE